MQYKNGGVTYNGNYCQLMHNCSYLLLIYVRRLYIMLLFIIFNNLCKYVVSFEKVYFAFPSVPRWCAEADAQPAVYDVRRHEPRTNVFHYKLLQPFISLGLLQI